MNHSVSCKQILNHNMNSIYHENLSFPAHLVDEPQEPCHESRDDNCEVTSNSSSIEPVHSSIFRPMEQENQSSPNQSTTSQSMPKSCVVSFTCDEEGDICLDPSNHDACTPLDYRRDWSIDDQSSLHKILRTNDSTIQESPYDLMKCESIASIDMESDCGEDFSSEPLGDWIEDDGIMW
jgi:hypothetical protein